MIKLAALLMCFALATLPGPALAQAPDLAAKRPALLAALQSAERGQLSVQEAARHADHPLLPWLQVLSLRRQIASATPTQVQALLGRHGDQPATAWLREAWLAELVRRQDWPGFRRDYKPSDSPELRCAYLAARLVAGENDAGWVAEAQALWRTGQSLPSSCDPVFRALENQGQLDAALRWERIELAAVAGQTALMRFLSGRLPPAEAARARDYADFIDAPHGRASQWPRDQRSRRVAAEGLARLARRSPDAAEAQLARLAPVLGMDEVQRGRVLYEVALWTVASYLPGSAARLNAVPAVAYDDRLHEWRVREALNRRDYAAALAGIEAMVPPQRLDPRWQYFEARLREIQGQASAAKPLYAAAAATATFHGFLAADRLGQPYTLCALEPSKDADLRRRVLSHPGLVRALELYQVDRLALALREWSALMRELDHEERYVAIEQAMKAHWYDRAVFTIGTRPEDLRQYRLRFPLHHEQTLRAEAQKHSLDPAWVAAQTRAESAFMPRARSGADARGLMQLLPGTGAMTARRLGLPWSGADSLYDPRTNLVLGIAHLRHELNQHGLPYLAIAAYNAGPAPVGRWQQARSSFDPDLWIETIPYKETRDYVARVLAFSVIYDWRLDGDAVPVSERLLGRQVPKKSRRNFHCPTPATGAAP